MADISNKNERQLRVTVNETNMTPLSASGYQLQVAKSVISNGKLHFNVIWRSDIIQPTTDVIWEPKYGINWTAKLFADGVTVAVGGSWQEAKLGQIFDINPQGQFTKSTKAPTPDYIAIGTNNYKNPQTAPLGIRIVIGVKEGMSFRPIFVDPVGLGFNMSASFQPQEKLEWWYSAGSRSSTMFTNHTSSNGEGNFSAKQPSTENFRMISAYSFADGSWHTNALADKDAAL